MPTADGKQVTPPANRAPYPSVRIVRTDRSYIHLPGGNGCPVCAQPHRTGVAAGNSHNLPPARDTALSAGILSGGNNATAKLQPDEMRTSGSYRPYVAPVGNSRLHTAVLAHGNHGSVRTQSCDDMLRDHDILQGIPSGKQRTRVRRQPVGIGTAPGCVQRRMLPAEADAAVLRHTQRQRIRTAQQADMRPVGYTTGFRIRRAGIQHAPVRTQSQRMRAESLHIHDIFPRIGAATALGIVAVSPHVTVPAQRQHMRCAAGQRDDIPPCARLRQSPGNENMPVRRDAGGQPGSAGKPPSVPGRLRQSEQVCLSGTLDFCPLCPAVGGKVLKLSEQRCPVEQIAPAGVHPVARSS